MANHGHLCLNYDLINKSDAQIFTICGHPTRLRLIGPSENGLESNMTDSLDFFSSEIRDYRIADFCVHTYRFSRIWLKKVSRLGKIRQWDHGINVFYENIFVWIK